MTENNSEKVEVTAKPRRSLSVIIMLIVIVLLFAGLVFWQYAWQHKMQRRLFSATKQLDQQSLAIQQAESKLEDTLKTHTIDPAVWVLPEVKYLIQMAAVSLTANRDVTASITLLKQADNRVATLNASAMQDLRKALADDIAALQAQTDIDVMGTVSQLDALNATIFHQPLVPSSPVQAAKNMLHARQNENVNKSWWQSLKRFSVTELKQIVVITRHDESVKPLPSPAQQLYLQQSIQVQFTLAKWALLHHNQQVYQNALQQAITLTKQCFAYNAVVMRKILKSIAVLQKIDVAAKLPPLTASQQAVDAALQKYGEA